MIDEIKLSSEAVYQHMLINPASGGCSIQINSKAKESVPGFVSAMYRLETNRYLCKKRRPQNICTGVPVTKYSSTLPLII